MKKRTSILLDVDLVRDVAAILGTRTIGETLHAVLEERVRQERERAEGVHGDAKAERLDESQPD